MGGMGAKIWRRFFRILHCGAGGQAAVWERGMARGVRERRGGGKIM